MKFGTMVVMFVLLINTIVSSSVNAAHVERTAWIQTRGDGDNVNGTEYLQGVAHKIMLVLGIVATVVIAVMWVFVALEFFSPDAEKKAKAKEHALWAAVGTIIIAMAVGGIIWMLAQWLVS